MVQKLSTTFVLGYHGCDKVVAEDVLAGEPFKHARNVYDWLGHGIYFWEANPVRALEYARELKASPHKTSGTINEPAAVGAVIDNGLCLDLTSSMGIRALEAVHESFVRQCNLEGRAIPTNSGGTDLLLRHLDCAVIEHLHKINKDAGRASIDTVRGVFLEGDQVYSGSAFRRKTHIQICVRNPSNIEGIFRVPGAHLHSAV